MENYATCIALYRQGLITREQALKVARSRLIHSYQNSIGSKELKKFIKELETKLIAPGLAGEN